MARWVAQATPTRGGDYTLVRFSDELDLRYARLGNGVFALLAGSPLLASLQSLKLQRNRLGPIACSAV